MTASVGGVSTSVIAVIAVSGIGGLLALITITAWLCDLPARLRRRKAAKEGGRQSPGMDEVEADVEKNEPTVSVTEVNSQIGQTSQVIRALSPVCQCEHPSIPPRTATQSPRLPSHPTHN
jgi:hypothetical protein